MDFLQEYKELYYKEIEHSERLNNKINTCITFLTVLGSAQVLLWTQFKNFEYKIYSIIYFLICVISLILFIFCLFKFYRAYSGYEYHYFPIKSMSEVSNKTYLIAGDNKKDIKRANKHIYNMYCERFLNDAIANRHKNEIKNKRHKTLTKYLCISFIITILVFSFGVGIEYYESKYIDDTTIHIILEGDENNER